MTEGDDGGGREGSLASRQHLEFNQRVMPPPAKATSRFDLDDKFGKFEIKTLIEGITSYSMCNTFYYFLYIGINKEVLTSAIKFSDLFISRHTGLLLYVACWLVRIFEPIIRLLLFMGAKYGP